MPALRAQHYLTFDSFRGLSLSGFFFFFFIFPLHFLSRRVELTWCQATARDTMAFVAGSRPSQAQAQAQQPDLHRDDNDKKRKIKWNTEPYVSIMKRAVELAMQGSSTTKVASQFTIPARTLRRYVAAERRANGDFSDMRGHGNTNDIPPHKLQEHLPHSHRLLAAKKPPSPQKPPPRGKKSKGSPGRGRGKTRGRGQQSRNSSGGRSSPDNPFARENLPDSTYRQKQHSSSLSAASLLADDLFGPHGAGSIDAMTRKSGGSGAASFDSTSPPTLGIPWKRNRFPSSGSLGSADALHDKSRTRLFSAASVDSTGIGAGAGSGSNNTILYRPSSPWDEERLGAALNSAAAMAQSSSAGPTGVSDGDDGVAPVIDLPPSDYTTSGVSGSGSGSWKEPSLLVAQIGDKGEQFGNPSRTLRAESLDLFRQAFESMADNETVREFKRANSGSGVRVPVLQTCAFTCQRSLLYLLTLT